MRQLASRRGKFGKIRVIERLSDGSRYYLAGASVQTLIDATGTSLLGYVNAFKLMLRERKEVLVIGGGGGSLASMLARKGHAVEVVDIDPAAEALAREFFGLDDRVHWTTQDAHLYLRSALQPQFDAIVMDACTAEATVPAFTDPDWLSDTMSRTKACGALLVNLSHDEPPPDDGKRLADAVAARGYYATLLQPQYGWEGNEILQISREPAPVNFQLADVLQRPAEARSYLMSLGAYYAEPNA